VQHISAAQQHQQCQQ